MARNRNREFSEGNGLNPKDLGAYGQDAEERLPVWAQNIEENRAGKGSYAAWKRPAGGEETGEQDEPKQEQPPADQPGSVPPAPVPDEPLQEETEETEETESPLEERRMPEPPPLERRYAENEDGQEDGGLRERVLQARAEKEDPEAEQPREAQRVESGALRRRNAPAAEESVKPAGGKGKKKKQGKKTGKGKGKKGKKKKATPEEERQGFFRAMMIVVLCGGLFFLVAVMVVSNFVSLPILNLPRRVITNAFSPVQSVFSSVTDSVVEYLRMLKIRGNIEYEYEQLRAKLDDYATDVAMMEELRRENEALSALVYEHQQPSHSAMNPLGAQVIGKVGNNYFSTLTLNVGTDDGVTDYMAVVSNGGLVGVTYNVRAGQCDVRCIIDSDCTVAGLVQSSRDQGSVKGTLGTNGEPMCRMYYLPDNSLPRPGDVVVTSGVGLEFPKGIPIGYIRESTRGMEENKSYVVLEPVVDFQHLEYVTVYRYRPSYAENAQSRVSTSQNIALEPLTTARPIPSFEMEGLSDFMQVNMGTATPAAAETPKAGVTPGPTLRLAPTPNPRDTALPPNLEYVAPSTYGETPSPSPRPTFTPTPSPVPTPDPGALTVEDDE